MTDNNQQNIIIYNTADGRASVALYARDGNVWLNQQQMAELFATSKSNISMHIAGLLRDRELDKNSVVQNYLTTAADGKNYNVVYYSLEMILAVGFRVRGKRGTQFRQWANLHLSEYLVKGFTMDDERLKNPDGRPDYFDELLERIREEIDKYGDAQHGNSNDGGDGNDTFAAVGLYLFATDALHGAVGEVGGQAFRLDGSEGLKLFPRFTGFFLLFLE